MGLVQPIVVWAGSHEDTVAAVAIASALSVARRFDTETYRAWLDGSFAKSVRRTRSGGFARLSVRARSVFEFGSARAAAFDPCEQMDPDVARLPVAGLERSRTGAWPSQAGPVVAINTDVAMSTGKTAAQAAHALGLWVLTQSEGAREWWRAHPELTVAERSFARLGLPELLVRDNGLTEVTAGVLL